MFFRRCINNVLQKNLYQLVGGHTFTFFKNKNYYEKSNFIFCLLNTCSCLYIFTRLDAKYAKNQVGE